MTKICKKKEENYQKEYHLLYLFVSLLAEFPLTGGFALSNTFSSLIIVATAILLFCFPVSN